MNSKQIAVELDLILYAFSEEAPGHWAVMRAALDEVSAYHSKSQTLAATLSALKKLGHKAMMLDAAEAGGVHGT